MGRRGGKYSVVMVFWGGYLFIGGREIMGVDLEKVGNLVFRGFIKELGIYL